MLTIVLNRDFMPYFDHNATTPLLPAAREAWLRASDEAWHNPGSPYRVSARAHRLLEEARERVAALIGAQPREIVFTSGATEANNASIGWAARALPTDSLVFVSPTEHPSVIEPARVLFGSRVRWITVDAEGHLDLAALERALRSHAVGFVAAMAANNETGVLGPHVDVAQLCRESGAMFLCDASQWIGRLPARDLPGDAFVVGCAHKFGGPKGVGFLRVPPRATGFHGARGGEQESGRRGGTENYPSVAAMVAAVEFAEAQSAPRRDMRAGWRDACAASVLAAVSGARVNAPGAERLWNTISLRMPAHENTRWVARLDKLGFEVSTGSACASGSSAPSHVLAAMGLSPDEARRTIRVSAGWETTEQDWRWLAEAIANVWAQFQAEGGSAVVEP